MEELKDLMEINAFDKLSKGEKKGIDKVRKEYRKNLKELDISKEIMYIIARDSIERLTENGERLIENREKLKEYLDANETVKEYKKDKEKIKIRNGKQISIDFLYQYIEYLDTNDIVARKAMEKICELYDPDASIISNYIFCKTMPNLKGRKIHSIKGEKYNYKMSDKNGIYFRGDTMNSWWITLKTHLKIKEGKKTYLGNKKMRQELVKKVDEKTDGAACREFMKVVYTIGNFISLPHAIGEAKGEINRPRGTRYTQDYWDLALFYIYKWCVKNKGKDLKEKDKDSKENEYNDEDLKKIVGDIPNNIALCKEWLKQFDNEWDNFVEKNFMQPFVKEENSENGKYGEPYELWDGHFKGSVLPKEEWQFEQFFVNARIRIQQRSELIAQALIENQMEEPR